MRTANDEWKRRWSDRMGWAITVSAALHALLFLFSPRWDRADPRLDPVEAEETAWISLQTLPSVGLSGGLALAPPVAGESDTLPPAPAGMSDQAGGEGRSSRLAELLRNRLRGRDAPVPTLAEPEVREEPRTEESPGAGDGDGPDIDAAAATADIAATLEGEGLDLGRLSELRPELALMGSSDWIRVRNPSQVERYMARIYDIGRVSPGATGQVALTLWIDERGSVEWAEITESSGRSELDEVALALFNDVVAFEPALEEGVPVSVPATFWVRFPWF